MSKFSLKQHGYEIIEAVDGRDAHAQLMTRKVDMFQTDLNMPPICTV